MKGNNILFLGEDLNMMRAVEIVLEQAGYKIIYVPANGVLFPAADLILIDFEKDKEKFYKEFTISIKKLIPVFVLCTQNVLKYAEGCRADKYIIKPFEIADFLGPINEILNPVLKEMLPAS